MGAVTSKICLTHSHTGTVTPKNASHTRSVTVKRGIFFNRDAGKARVLAPLSSTGYRCYTFPEMQEVENKFDPWEHSLQKILNILLQLMERINQKGSYFMLSILQTN